MSQTQLNSIVEGENKALKDLLKTLEEQFEYISKRDVFNLDAVREKIEVCSRNVARFEVERRNITSGRAMSEIVAELNNEELNENYREIKKTLEAINLQKETNELLIKQGLGFTAQMLNLINPDKGPKTYNSYGKRK